jgi:hypothetical protein
MIAYTVRATGRRGIGANDAGGSNGRLPAPPRTSNPSARRRFTQPGSSRGCSGCGTMMHLVLEMEFADPSNFAASRRAVKDVRCVACWANLAILRVNYATDVTR